eukprot:1459643-Amphidinium_carterae.1
MPLGLLTFSTLIVGVIGARLRSALCITHCLSVRLGMRPEGNRGFPLMLEPPHRESEGPYSGTLHRVAPGSPLDVDPKIPH